MPNALCPREHLILLRKAILYIQGGLWGLTHKSWIVFLTDNLTANKPIYLALPRAKIYAINLLYNGSLGCSQKLNLQ